MCKVTLQTTFDKTAASDPRRKNKEVRVVGVPHSYFSDFAMYSPIANAAAAQGNAEQAYPASYAACEMDSSIAGLRTAYLHTARGHGC